MTPKTKKVLWFTAGLLLIPIYFALSQDFWHVIILLIIAVLCLFIVKNKQKSFFNGLVVAIGIVAFLFIYSLATPNEVILSPESTIKISKQILSDYPNNPKVLYDMGMAYLKLNKTQEGIEYLQKARAIYVKMNGWEFVSEIDKELKKITPTRSGTVSQNN